MPSGESGGNGFIFDLPTAKTSPLVVNQSPFLPDFFSYCSAVAVVEHLHLDAVPGSTSGLSPSSASSGTHTKTPELPAARRCRHSTTSSKLVNFCRVRITPIGWPVQ